jgi:hypothetical protein
MTVIASGIYGLTAEKQYIDTSAQSMESETVVKGLLCTDTEAPNFDTHDFRNDIVAEVPATGGYTAGGVVLTTTDWTIGAPVAGTMKYDHDDAQWASSTIAAAMALVVYFNVGTTATDQLLYLLDFVTAGTTNNGLFLVQIHSNGAINYDHTP